MLFDMFMPLHPAHSTRKTAKHHRRFFQFNRTNGTIECTMPLAIANLRLKKQAAHLVITTKRRQRGAGRVGHPGPLDLRTRCPREETRHAPANSERLRTRSAGRPGPQRVHTTCPRQGIRNPAASSELLRAGTARAPVPVPSCCQRPTRNASRPYPPSIERRHGKLIARLALISLFTFFTSPHCTAQTTTGT